MKSQNKIAFFNILSTVVLRGVSIFTAPVFSRLLGDNSYGIVSVYSTWVSIAAILFTLQTQQTLVNARVDFPQEEQPKYQSSVMSLSGMVFFGLLGCGAAVVKSGFQHFSAGPPHDPAAAVSNLRHLLRQFYQQ